MKQTGTNVTKEGHRYGFFCNVRCTQYKESMAKKYSINVYLLRRMCANQRAIHDFIAK